VGVLRPFRGLGRFKGWDLGKVSHLLMQIYFDEVVDHSEVTHNTLQVVLNIHLDPVAADFSETLVSFS